MNSTLGSVVPLAMFKISHYSLQFICHQAHQTIAKLLSSYLEAVVPSHLAPENCCQIANKLNPSCTQAVLLVAYKLLSRYCKAILKLSCCCLAPENCAQASNKLNLSCTQASLLVAYKLSSSINANSQL